MEIKAYLESHGFKLLDRGSYWHSNAAFRDGNNPTALQIYKNTGCWKDFVHGNGDFLPFLLLQEKIGSEFTGQLDYVSKESDLITMNKTYPISDTERLMPAHGFYNKKGISSDILKTLKSGFANSGKLHSRYVFPIFSEDGSCIVGFSGRYVGQINDAIPKWKHLGKKSEWIYPIYEDSIFEKAVLEKGEIILVESIGDFLALYECGIKNVLVTFGISVSNKIITYLSRFHKLKIIIAFNNDNTDLAPGLFGALKAYCKLADFFGKGRVSIILPDLKDFGQWYEKKGRDFIREWDMLSDQTNSIFLKCKDISEKNSKTLQNFQKIAHEYDKLKRKSN